MQIVLADPNREFERFGSARSVRRRNVAAEVPVISDGLAVRDGRLAVQQHTTEMAELEMRAAQAQRETQRALQRQMTDQRHAERLAHEELRKTGRKFLRETPGYGQRWIDHYGSDPDLIEQVGLFALGRGGALPPSWAEMRQHEWLERIRSLSSQQEWWRQPDTELQKVERRIEAYTPAFRLPGRHLAGTTSTAKGPGP